MLLPDKEARYIRGEKIRLLPITVNEDNKGKIVLVGEKAAAGYLQGYADREYISNLPVFSMPGMGEGVAFEVQGDSMEPFIYAGDIVVATYLENWTWIKNEELCVVVTKDDGIAVKYVKNLLLQTNELLLRSENTFYPEKRISAKSINQILKVRYHISTRTHSPIVKHEFENRLTKIEREISALKKYCVSG